MSEFPLIQKFITQTQHKSILQALEVRFGEVPHDISTRLGRIRQEKRLEELHRCAVICPNLEAFRKKLRGEA